MSDLDNIPTVKIPEADAIILFEISKLDQNSIESIKKIYDDINNVFHLTNSEKPLLDVIAEKIKFPISEIISTLYAAASTIRASGISEDDVISSIRIKISETPGNELNAQNINNIKSIIGLESGLSRGLAAVDTYIAHDKTPSAFRIITDMRPIFTNDKGGTILSNVVIYHNLEISLNGSDRRKEFFALDSSDLLNLQRVIERALLKEKILIESVDKGVTVKRISKMEI